MFFQKRLDRARAVQRHLSGLDREDEAPEAKDGVAEEDAAGADAMTDGLPSVEADAVDAADAPSADYAQDDAEEGTRKRRFFRRKKREVDDTITREMEKGDMPAMLAAGFLTLFLPAVAVLVVLVLIVYLIFGLF